jgi:hypothetical protein
MKIRLVLKTSVFAWEKSLEIDIKSWSVSVINKKNERNIFTLPKYWRSYFAVAQWGQFCILLWIIKTFYLVKNVFY